MSEEGRRPLLQCWIRTEADVAVAVHQFQKTLLSNGTDQVLAHMIATVAAELGHNIVRYASYGHLALYLQDSSGAQDCWVRAEDIGPGIASVEQAMTDGFSTGGSLGLGLPGVRRMMDEVTVDEDYVDGARVWARKRIP